MKITTVRNGFILEDEQEDEEGNINRTQTLFEAAEGDLKEVEAFQRLLNEIIDVFGMRGSRYDEKRIYVILAPGDKNEKFTEEDARVIWGGDTDSK